MTDPTRDERSIETITASGPPFAAIRSEATAPLARVSDWGAASSGPSDEPGVAVGHLGSSLFAIAAGHGSGAGRAAADLAVSQLLSMARSSGIDDGRRSIAEVMAQVHALMRARELVGVEVELLVVGVRSGVLTIASSGTGSVSRLVGDRLIRLTTDGAAADGVNVISLVPHVADRLLMRAGVGDRHVDPAHLVRAIRSAPPDAAAEAIVALAAPDPGAAAGVVVLAFGAVEP